MKSLKVGGVLLVAMLLTTLGISASDMLTSGDSVVAQLIGGSEDTGPCPAGMLHVPTGGTFTCVDQYEVSPSDTCPHRQPAVGIQTAENIASSECVPVSVAEQQPWVFVTREQAAQLCVRARKRLPTAAEWYHVAIDTPTTSESCNLSGAGMRPATLASSCRSAAGAIDMVGNVWEWVADDVIDGTYNGRPLPSEGYVAAVDSGGVVTEVAGSPQPLFAADYAWTESRGSFGMLRGGYFGSREDGGVFALQAKTRPTAATGATGFRCVL